VRILVCNYEYPPLGGGGGVMTKRLAEELGKRHSVTVLTSGYSGSLHDEVVNGVQVYRVSVARRKRRYTASLVSMLLYWPMSFVKGSQLCRTGKYDLIHSHFAIPTGPSSLMLAKKFGIPHVLSIHGGDIFDPSKALSPHKTWGLHATVQKVINQSDRVLAQSRNTLANAQKYYHVTRPIDIVPLAIDRPNFMKADREALGFNNDDVLLITIGRLVARKGIHLLIDMMTRFDHDRVKLLVLGEGPDRETLEETAAQRGVSSRIIFKGWVSDSEKFQLLNVADVFVSSALHEGFGLIFIEAMACGLPIVSFDNGGHTDFLIDGKTGYLVPVGIVDSFLDRVTYLCKNQELRTQFGSFNKNLAEDYFMETCAARHEKVFAEVIAGMEPSV